MLAPSTDTWRGTRKAAGQKPMASAGNGTTLRPGRCSALWISSRLTALGTPQTS
jgi:hypothetical protein